MPAPRRDKNVPLPPQNLEAEEYVLGALMLSPAAIEAVSEIVGPRDFYRESHGRIFQACLDLHAAGGPLDAITVAAHLEENGLLTEVGGKERIRDIATLVPVALNAPHHARLVREAAARRALITTGETIARLGWEPDGEVAAAFSEAERQVFELSQTHGRSRGDLVHASVIADDTWRLMEELAASGRKLVGLPTGFRALDRITSGLRAGNLVLIAGRPSMGKSALALCAILNITIRNDPPVPVALFSLEMSQTEIMQRFVASEALVDGVAVQNPGRLGADEWERVGQAMNRISGAPLYIDETGSATMTEIRTKARRLKLREPTLGLLVVDYVQLMTSGVRADNRNAELSQISRAMKMLAVELGIPVLVLSQLSRAVEERHDKRPVLSDLRDSGALEQDADVVMMVYRDEYYFPEEDDNKGIAEVRVEKQRNGPVGMRKLAFVSQFARFTDLHQPMEGVHADERVPS